MRTKILLGASLLMASMAAGCGDSGSTTDAGTDLGNTIDVSTSPDTGSPVTDTGVDAGTPTTDHGSPTTDTGTDAGTPTTDQGTPTTDTGVDAGTPTTDVGVDAGSFTVLHGCNAGDYIDHRPASDTRAVAFGDAVGLAYSPKCLTIAAGQGVTFNGSFTSHPLRGGVAPSHTGETGAAATTPITSTGTGSTATFTFAAPGFYPYYCNFHEGSGMVGVIQVL